MLSKKEYENVIIKNDKFTEDTMIALGLVKKYISEHKLLIVGGMAIDLALRLKGSHLYEDDVLPDYDFYSPQYHIDAYHIAEKLKKSGLKNISVINANHISTMRVRVNYTVVADVTYMPQKIYNKLPFLLYRDLRIIHPHYQLIDQHRALSYPYENPPWEVITHRWKKDATRYDILYKYYPLKTKGIKVENEFKLSAEITLSSIVFKDQCVSGFAGLLYWVSQANKLGFKNKYLSLGKFHKDIGGFIVQIPEDSHGVSIYSNNVIQLRKDINNKETIKDERQYNRFLDKLPHKFILDNKYELFDNKGYLISAHKTDNDIYVSNLQNIMLYMLTNIIILHNIKETDRGYSFYIGYLTAQSIIEWASNQYKKGNKKKSYMKFLPDINVYGTDEISDSYINSKRQFLEKIKEIEYRPFQPSIVFPETFVDNKIPKKYFTFTPNKSPILQFDGSETNTYYDRIYL